MEKSNEWQYQKLNTFGFSFFNKTEMHCLIVLEVIIKDPGAGRFGFFEASLLDCRWQPSRCLHMIGKRPCFQSCTILDVSLRVQMSSYKDTSHTGLGPHRWPHIKLIAS